MRYLILLLILLSCSDSKKDVKPFLIVTDTNDEWINYEGYWQTEGGLVWLELALKAGAFGMDAEYKLREIFESDSLGASTTTTDTYTTSFRSSSDNTLGIVLHRLGTYSHRSYFRYKNEVDQTEEMFFITKGPNELIPCDNNFVPLTSDNRYTLHRRSELVTVEGYVTFDSDSVEFFERNTRKYYTVARFGKFQELTENYKKLATDKYEGVYIKALAYTVVDSSAINNKALVFKNLLMVGSETENLSITSVEQFHDALIVKK